MTRKKGLSGTALKVIAAGCMLLDHIAYFFGFTGAVPAVFTMLGRLAAPLFLLCLAEGFAHTHDRRRYFLRIYAMAAAMGALYFAMAYLGLGVRGDGFVPQNGILTTYALLLIVWQAWTGCVSGDGFGVRWLLPYRCSGRLLRRAYRWCCLRRWGRSGG